MPRHTGRRTPRSIYLAGMRTTGSAAASFHCWAISRTWARRFAYAKREMRYDTIDREFAAPKIKSRAIASTRLSSSHGWRQATAREVGEKARPVPIYHITRTIAYKWLGRQRHKQRDKPAGGIPVVKTHCGWHTRMRKRMRFWQARQIWEYRWLSESAFQLRFSHCMQRLWSRSGGKRNSMLRGIS